MVSHVNLELLLIVFMSKQNIVKSNLIFEAVVLPGRWWSLSAFWDSLGSIFKGQAAQEG